MSVRLYVNVDHVATLRQARGERYPDPVHAAVLCERAGADGITVHLREDRRHIQDRDVHVMREVVSTYFNLEMAATEEMLEIACEVVPEQITLVPERREEVTTEGGLDVAGNLLMLRGITERAKAKGIEVSVFIDPDPAQIKAAIKLGVHAIELHTGEYARGVEGELERLASAADLASSETDGKLRIAAGHGLTLQNLAPLVSVMPSLEEVNIGHALVADAIFVGIEESVRRYQDRIRDGEYSG